MFNPRFYLSSLVTGTLFGMGLAISGMTDPGRVLDFLDLAGDWNPSLLFVLGAAVAVTVIAFRWILQQKKPLFSDNFSLPTRTAIDRDLVVGSLIFGIGWGISGYCPGPAIASLASPNWESWIFLPAMLLGALLHRVLQTSQAKKD